MYELSEDLKRLAEKTIQKFPELKHLNNPDLNIVYLISCKRKKNGHKVVFADTQKTTDKIRAISGTDFIITFYSDSLGIGDERMEILMHHELLHVGYDGEKRYIIPHDICDFRDIIEQHGLDWVRN